RQILGPADRVGVGRRVRGHFDDLARLKRLAIALGCGRAQLSLRVPVFIELHHRDRRRGHVLQLVSGDDFLVLGVVLRRARNHLDRRLPLERSREAGLGGGGGRGGGGGG